MHCWKLVYAYEERAREYLVRSCVKCKLREVL